MTLEKEEQRKDGPPRFRLAALGEEPAVVAELRRNDPALRGAVWKHARIGQMDLYESSALPQSLAHWEAIREIAQHHGLVPVLSFRSLDVVEPDISELEESLTAATAGAGEALLEKATERGRRWAEQAGEEEEEWNCPYDDDDDDDDEADGSNQDLSGSELRLEMEAQHLVLLRGMAAQVAIIYQFAREELSPRELASVLMAWNDRFEAELAAFGGDTMEVVLPHPITGEQEISRCALEIFGLDPDLESPSDVQAMAATRLWSFWWD